MKVSELAEYLQTLVEQGKGEFDVVLVNGNGQEKSLVGAEVMEQGFFKTFHEGQPNAAKKHEDRSRPRLRFHMY